MPLESTSSSRTGFRTTQWTLVEHLDSGEDGRRASAIAALAEQYWPPVYASIRQAGRAPEHAAELTQAFFSEVVLGRALFQRADRERGRLRTYLLAALKRFLVDQHRRSVDRAGGCSAITIDTSREEAFLTDAREADPEIIFERRWATAMLEEALRRSEEHFQQRESRRHWCAFERCVLQPATRGRPAPPLAEVATELGYESAAQLAAGLQVARKRVRLLLREVIAETVENAEDEDAEFNRVVSLLS